MLVTIKVIDLLKPQFCKLNLEELSKVVNNEDNDTGYGLWFTDYSNIKGNTCRQKAQSVRKAQLLLGVR